MHPPIAGKERCMSARQSLKYSSSLRPMATTSSHRAQSQRWTTLGLPASLTVRLTLHTGPVVRCLDPLMERENYTGTYVSRAARLELATPPGEVYASEAFAALAAVERVTEFTCEHVQQPTRMTHYSTFPAYVIRRVPSSTQRGNASR